jgi:Uma2 family endonuclease
MWMAQELKISAATPLVTPSTPPKMSYEEFLDWADEDTWAEWVNGEVTVLSPASKVHQSLMRFLSAVLSLFVEEHQLGEVFTAPFQMKLATRPSGREPDLIFVANEHGDRLKSTFLDGPADLVIEIVSPESQVRDRGEKFYEYEEAGVPEYWMIDRTRRQAEFYEVGEDGRYSRIDADKNGIFRSRVLEGLWLRVDWLWQDPVPTLMTVLKESGLVKDS